MFFFCLSCLTLFPFRQDARLLSLNFLFMASHLEPLFLRLAWVGRWPKIRSILVTRVDDSTNCEAAFIQVPPSPPLNSTLFPSQSTSFDFHPRDGRVSLLIRCFHLAVIRRSAFGGETTHPSYFNGFSLIWRQASLAFGPVDTLTVRD